MKLLLAFAVPLFLIAAAPSVPKAKYSESRRFETRTMEDGNSSTTESADGGKWNLTADVPIDDFHPGADTKFSIKLGRIDSTAALSDDPKFKDGAKSAQLDLKMGQENSIVAVAKLKWGKDKLNLSLSGKTDRTMSPVAANYSETDQASFSGSFKVTVQFGEKSTEIEVPFTATMKRKTVDLPGLRGGATTIDMKGETK